MANGQSNAGASRRFDFGSDDDTTRWLVASPYHLFCVALVRLRRVQERPAFELIYYSEENQQNQKVMSHWLIGWLIVMCVVPALVIIIGKFFTKKSSDYNFTKDVLVPVSTPLVVAMIGVVFTLQSEDQQKADQQTAVMREVMVS